MFFLKIFQRSELQIGKIKTCGCEIMLVRNSDQFHPGCFGCNGTVKGIFKGQAIHRFNSQFSGCTQVKGRMRFTMFFIFSLN